MQKGAKVEGQHGASSRSSLAPDTAIATRTLLTAGFTITNSHRQPGHIELQCERGDFFGVSVRYLIAVCDGDCPPGSDLPNIVKEAEKTRRTLLIVCRIGGANWISWQDFLNSLGGAVPSWRAIGAEYPKVLSHSASNSVPKGYSGEAWQIYEDAVADGFEFVLANRVNRLGGKTRGKRVSDMITQTPNNRVLVLDAKASHKPFNVTWPELRALVEYTTAQIERQRGHYDVHGAVLVAKDFKQDVTRLGEVASQFLAEVRVPLTFMRSDELAYLVKAMTGNSVLRSSMNWGQVFCRGGLLVRRQIDREIAEAKTETYPRGRPLRRGS